MLTETAPIECLVYSVEEAARLLGISRNHAYDSVRTGDIPAVRLGRKWLVPRVALERMLSDTAEKGAAQ